MLYEQYETSYLFYVTLSFLCNIICYLISLFAFSLVTLSGATSVIMFLFFLRLLLSLVLPCVHLVYIPLVFRAFFLVHVFIYIYIYIYIFFITGIGRTAASDDCGAGVDIKCSVHHSLLDSFFTVSLL